MRDNNYECSQVMYFRNKNAELDTLIKWGTVEKDQEWKKKINEINLAFIYNHIDYGHYGKPLRKVLELYEKALAEKDKRLLEIENALKNILQANSELIEQIEIMKCCNNCRYEEYDEAGIEGCSNKNSCDGNFSGWELKE